MNEIVKSQVVGLFRSAIKTNRKRENTNDIFILLMYKDETEPYCYLKAGEKDIEERELKSLLNTMDYLKVEGLEAVNSFKLLPETASIIKEIADKKKIDPAKIKLCIYEQKTKVVVTIYDNDKELSCSLLQNEI